MASPLLDSRNRLRLAVFSPNMAGGANLTHSPDAPQLTWEESARIARMAEAAGIEAIIPVARWRGMAAPERRQAHRSFETFTWAAGIAAITSRIQVFATFHIPVTHPVTAAKQIATVDHISGGRFAVNLVAGWNSDEFRMFGLDQREHDDRYALANEWMTLLKRIWAAEEEFDFTGRYYRGTAILSEPKPLRPGGPIIMNAGFSPAGQDFAARHADITFAMLPGIDAAAALVAPIKERKPQLRVFAAAHVVCAATDGQARAEYARMVGELGDRQAAERAIRLLIGSSRSGDFDGMVNAAIAGFFALPLVGSPETVVAQMAALADAGVDGLALSWLNYEAGLQQYADTLRPMLERAGLRQA
ncbi:LLM class flavin-dependent oxidoreductase [Nonomuraea sp. LPB2021202275-12-8]|uniref:LLM class flavin-dependent oxidoreductase n=1 Tax=Nonomuraea sp. LPB2021202275-12-8 TaxID=3120159 RepID=UPI00300DA743